MVGAAERLVGTPVPLSYSAHTSRFLSIWCFTLPLTLVGLPGPAGGSVVAPLGVPIVMFLVCWALFATEEIGHVIEEPFKRGVEGLPLESYVAALATELADERRGRQQVWAAMGSEQGARSYYRGTAEDGGFDGGASVPLQARLAPS